MRFFATSLHLCHGREPPPEETTRKWLCSAPRDVAVTTTATSQVSVAVRAQLVGSVSGKATVRARRASCTLFPADEASDIGFHTSCAFLTTSCAKPVRLANPASHLLVPTSCHPILARSGAVAASPPKSENVIGFPSQPAGRFLVETAIFPPIRRETSTSDRTCDNLDSR